MDAPEDKFGAFLKSRGLQFTPERRILLREVFEIHHHFTVEDLFDRLKAVGERVSMPTIYRFIPLLLESGMAKEAVMCRGNVTYEHTYGHEHHDHLVCVKCGRVYEFRNDEIERLQQSVCDKFNFQPLEHRLGIRGICAECRK